MISKSTILHLRIPFSLFLAPVYFFSLTAVENVEMWRVALVFFILHFLLYPASNSYNTWYDRDKSSIGSLKNPPEVTKDLLSVSLIFDGVAIVLGMFVSTTFAFMLFSYGMISKAYSHPAIRLKKHGVTSWLTAAIFQGGFSFLMVYEGMSGNLFYDINKLILPATLSTLMILGFYPLTQIYQHEEDAERGDMTISLKLGKLNTFHLSGLMFSIAAVGFYYYFTANYSFHVFLEFMGWLTPMFFYFILWYARVWKDAGQANFRHAMNINFIASISLIGFFLYLKTGIFRT